MRYSFNGLMSSGGIDGRVVRAANKWFFITRYAGKSFRYVFDTSADYTPEVGPAVLYGAIGTNSLAAVFQKGHAVGWFRADQRARVVTR